jgi:hypothetical protein
VSFVKCESWPAVTPDDNGIRPAGEKDECFYCHSKVGQKHGAECVCVKQRVWYRVLSEGREVGTYNTYDPYHWDFTNCEFHKNDSTWCADNAVEDIEWSDGEIRKEAYRRDAADDVCCCDLLSFEFGGVVDAGPFVYVKEKVDG